jgi:hypothetical protein
MPSSPVRKQSAFLIFVSFLSGKKKRKEIKK